jgi:hypothetical protein
MNKKSNRKKSIRNRPANKSKRTRSVRKLPDELQEVFLWI